MPGGCFGGGSRSTYSGCNKRNTLRVVVVVVAVVGGWVRKERGVGTGPVREGLMVLLARLGLELHEK